MIRARIHRARPAVWVMQLTEDVDGLPVPFVVGHAGTWEEARDAAVKELHIFDTASRNEPEPVPLVSPAARERCGWVSRLLGIAA